MTNVDKRRKLRNARKMLREARAYFGKSNFHMSSLKSGNGLKELRGLNARANPVVLSLKRALMSINSAAGKRL